MDTPSRTGSLEIEVSDFGPIVNAKVDLRPFTVFVGPSNTGKSYLAILIYALHRFFSGSSEFRNRRSADLPVFPHTRRRELPDGFLEATFDLARSLAMASIPADGIPLPRPVAEALQGAINANADHLVREITRCFGLATTGDLIRRGSRPGGARVTVHRRTGGPAPEVDVEQALTLAGTHELRMDVPADLHIDVDRIDRARFADWAASVLDETVADRDRLRSDAFYLLRSHGDLVLPTAVAPLHSPAHYLPASRTGIVHAHRVVVTALIASATTPEMGPTARTPVLSGVLAQFLDRLIRIDQPPGGRRPTGRRNLAEEIESRILQGTIRLDRSPATDYPHFAYRPDGWTTDIALSNASAMVSELAPIVLYLQHVVEPGDVLIVEEPESHLHPAMQVELTRLLAELVGSGIRVIVTTHSEWLVEELANVVRRSKLRESERARVSGSSVALHPEQVGAWLFSPKKRPKGSVVTEVPLEEYGFCGTGFDEVASALHNDWADISGRIEGIP